MASEASPRRALTPRQNILGRGEPEALKGHTGVVGSALDLRALLGIEKNRIDDRAVAGADERRGASRQVS